MTYNRIARAGLDLLDREVVGSNVSGADAILLRSHVLADNEIEPSVAAVVRAGAGVSNIPIDLCNRRGIVVFNTPGANANSVKELVIAALLIACRDVLGGIRFIESLPTELDATALRSSVEEGKKQFLGSELQGKTLGVIGLGAVGANVANTALALGMNVLGYDPYLSVAAAWRISNAVHRVDDLTSLCEQSDFVSLHVPASPGNVGMVDDEVLRSCQPGTVLVNFARASIVDVVAVRRALQNGTLSRYFVDFPSKELLGCPGVYATPHLGASTREAEENCAIMAARTLREFLVNGTIRNSVNFPDVRLSRSEGYRLTVANENVSGTLGSLLSLFADRKINVIDMINKSREEVAYNLIDIDTEPSDELLETMRDIHTVTAVRSLGLPV